MYRRRRFSTPRRGSSSPLLHSSSWVVAASPFLVDVVSASLLLCFSFSVLIIQTSEAQICLPKKHASLFLFGDSFFDNGNNNYINTTTLYQANYPPYGETLFKYPSGRFSDGRMIPDFIAELAKLPLLPPYLHPGNPDFTYGVNFASGGSGALLQTAQGYVIDLHTQVKYFKNVKKILREKIGDEEVEALLKRSVYFFNVGGNDYRGLLNVTNSTVRLLPIDKQQFVGFVIGNLTNAIKEIYEQGGRKFGFLNVGPIGCSPSIRILKNNGSTCFDEISAVARLHNIQLSKMTLKLKKQLNGFKYSVHDFYVSLSQVVTYPSKYGYKGGSGACCGSGPYRGEYTCGGNKGIKEYELCQNPNDYVFFDSHHPSDKACEYFAQLIWNGNYTFNKPSNLNQLFQFYSSIIFFLYIYIICTIRNY
ncbi:GDSL esterase/lipase 5 isoform X1 [Arachis ipaensis]|uniref:GDSL esterase/lipase 5 n=1 Tax=Arachis hypogaea TaxID=3818 RepID=UPI0007AF23F8|nr:GDSL esterase/lipase 5 isoform X2 [Arachis ipaensis]XP_016182727.1 GDSL esterase/lipase 5 isoform X1 [Arachis ipaensis]XP_025631987.1 GDSL esterase/lipase 5 [Arachis hypogaea]